MLNSPPLADTKQFFFTMTTVICGTHRPQNITQKIVDKYCQILKYLGEETTLFELGDLPADFVISDSFGARNESTESLLSEKLIPSDRMVIISPEYNGSYPGVLKAFLDGIPPRTWKGKKVALVGVAAGRAGNSRGMDHLTHVLHYLRMEVFSYKVPISQVDGLLDAKGELADEDTIQVLTKQAEEFLKF